MSRFLLSIVTALTFTVAMAVAQSNQHASQGNQSASPGMQQPQQNPNQPSANEPGTYPQNPSEQGTSPTSTQTDTGEHTLKGCIESQGGQSMLKTRKGKEIALTGEDVSAHAGHEVQLKGTWANSSAGMSQQSAGAAGGETFNVTSVKMISDTCSGSSKGSGTGSPSGGSTGNSSDTNPTQPQ